jgi:selenocysteine lyase/cysteine desulfurase
MENILITPGAIAANHLAFYSLISPGDHVICHYPTYQQLYEIPASLGAEVDLWKADPRKKWIPDLEDLRTLLKPNTKLIVVKYAVKYNSKSKSLIAKSVIQQSEQSYRRDSASRVTTLPRRACGK